jgi:UDP-2,4-diacetamido-2,4,6-trideoxy-beta-L-altropyranose hydrolase
MAGDQPIGPPEESLAGQTLLIRADASAHIGSGHVMRCLGLAQAWRSCGGEVVFLTHDTRPEPVAERICAAVDAVYYLSAVPGSEDDAYHTHRIARQVGAAAIVVDGYPFKSAYQEILKAAGFYLLIIDDMGRAGRYYADLILSQDIGAAAVRYIYREPYTRLLLGAEYILLRTEFLRWRDRQPVVEDPVRRVFVTMGGADPHNVTRKVIDALRSDEFAAMEIVIVVGESNPRFDELLVACREAGISLQRNVADMSEQMARADVAITAAGGTALELAFMGVPMLIIVSADDQKLNATNLERASAGISLGWCDSVTTRQIQLSLLELVSNAAVRRKLSQCGKMIIDGHGAMRIVNELINQKGATSNDRSS